MKNYLKISNDGLLDIRLVSLMGGSTKAGQQYKIGQFGTGLKYTLAFLLRNNVDFCINVGNKRIQILTETETIADVDYHIICIEGHRTSITTNMGLDWKPWMIVRELYSNALDEGNAKYEIVSSPTANAVEGSENSTSFIIELTPQFLEVYNNWNTYFIVNHIPMYSTDEFALHPTSGNFKIYKQGILIYQSEEKSIFSYDIKSAFINELREYKGNTEYDISRLLFGITDIKTIIYFLEKLNFIADSEVNYFEKHIDVNFWSSFDTGFNNAWKEAIGSAKIIHPDAKKQILSKVPDSDLSSTFLVPKNFYTALTQKFEGIGALRTVSKVNEFYEIYDTELSQQIKKAQVILETCDYWIHPELKIIIGHFGDTNIMGQINFDSKEILLSIKLRTASLFELISTLIEENEHFSTGYGDNSRELQTHLLNLYTRTLLKSNEIDL